MKNSFFQKFFIILICVMAMPIFALADSKSDDSQCYSGYVQKDENCIKSLPAKIVATKYTCENYSISHKNEKRVLVGNNCILTYKLGDEAINDTDSEALNNINLSDNSVQKITDCTSLLGNPETEGTPAFYLVKAFEVVKYVAIILLIVLTIIDFVGAVASQDNDVIMKTAKKAGIRAMLCVIIFLLPMLIQFVLKYVSDRAIDLCGIK